MKRTKYGMRTARIQRSDQYGGAPGQKIVAIPGTIRDGYRLKGDNKGQWYREDTLHYREQRKEAEKRHAPPLRQWEQEDAEKKLQVGQELTSRERYWLRRYGVLRD